MSALIDSYASSNRNNEYITGQGGNLSFGQVFLGQAREIESCWIFLSKYGSTSPTGDGTVKLWLATGTLASTGVPTGSALATSGTLDVSTLTATPTETTFTFTGANKITLTAGLVYVVTFNYSGGGGAHFVSVGIDSSSPTHAGHTAYTTDGTNWSTRTVDTCFGLYATDIGTPGARPCIRAAMRNRRR